MKVRSSFPLVIFLLTFSFASAQKDDLGVMTFNIRYDNPGDNEYSWENRKKMVFSVLADNEPEIIGFQEALKGQVDELWEFLKGYGHAGVGRDDGKNAGEFSPVFYDSARFVLKAASTFWLSESPDVPGTRSWNSACNRIVTWVRFFDKQAKKTIFVFNTHFDHISEQARIESAKLIVNRIERIAGNETVILTGDFNSTNTSQSYQILTDPSHAYPLQDTRTLAGRNAFGPSYSFIGFPFNPDDGNMIDFIFISKEPGLKVLQNDIINYHVKDKYPSDHLPVLTKLQYTVKN